MVTERKARVVGVNHVALEVGDIEEALAFYGEKRVQASRQEQHFSFHRSRRPIPRTTEGSYATCRRWPSFWTCGRRQGCSPQGAGDAGIRPLPGPFLDFLDPWGNRIEIYRLVTRRPVPIPVPTFLSDPTATPAVCHAVGALF